MSERTDTTESEVVNAYWKGWSEGFSWGHKKALLDLVKEFQSYEEYPEWWVHGQEMECVLTWLGLTLMSDEGTQ